MVDERGLVKVLDFGLAKLTEAAGPEGETISKYTAEGVIVGTPAYMSPEQAEGRDVDARSDIFSFGSVLYEMVTGHPAFEGDSQMSTLAAIMADGIYFMKPLSAGNSLEFLSFASGKTRSIASIEKPLALGLTVCAGQGASNLWILYAQLDQSGPNFQQRQASPLPSKAYSS